MGSTFRVFCNGHEITVEQGITVSELLRENDRDPRVVAVERNGEIVPRRSFAETSLLPGDRIEIVQFVQGG